MLLFGTFFSLNLSNNKSDHTGRSIASIKDNLGNQLKKVSSAKELRYLAKKESLKMVKTSGILHIEVAEDLNSKIHLENYFLLDASGRKQKIHAVSDIKKLAGREVYFDGYEYNGEVFGTLSRELPPLEPLPNLRHEKSLILMVNFNDSGNPWAIPEVDGNVVVTPENLAQELNDPSKVHSQFFKQVSRGAYYSNILHVEPWYTFNRNCADTSHPSNSTLIGYIHPNEIKQIIEDRNIDHTQFDNVSVIVNCELWRNWGVATLGKSLVFSDGHGLSYSESIVGKYRLYYGYESNPVPGFGTSSFLRVFIHERGHTFGINHSNGLDCGDNQLYQCSYFTYGNPFDVMGRGKTSLALSADQMRKEGLRPETQFINIKEEGNYYLSPLLSSFSNAKIGAYIYSEFSDKPVFMLENRTATGIDAQLQAPEYSDVRAGLQIYSNFSNSSISTSPRLTGSQMRIIDPKPVEGEANDLSHFADRVEKDGITVSNPFFDPITGIGIKILPLFSFSEGSRGEKSGIRFQVYTDSEKRVCFKSNLLEQTSDVYIPGSSEEESKVSSTFYLSPEQDFRLKVDTFQSNQTMCPREKIKVSLVNHSLLSGWTTPRDPRERSLTSRGLVPIEDEPFELPSEGLNLFTRVVEDRDSSYNLGQALTVPPNTPSGEIVLNFEYENERTGELRESSITLIIEGHAKKDEIKSNQFLRVRR